ncbi:hypothetical protein [Cellulomonas xiejunii]|uniref:Peptidase S9 n=1 Tax=Cellulomonas xiejunii TaxID=2968083 RepID=A0ABY5KUF9_9CELL|nr:hypothetical protein [Cellulomonas xiejunii]MCC2321380.1 hypothetical protein [Cellulomonas xiejunii]UUI71963.1 hypothetical protein NP048_00350 [Cellulomonas xiejunii]
MTTNPRSRALNAALTGLATAAYYAVPDVTRSRAARGWLKAACLAAAGAANAVAPANRGGWRELRSTWQDGVAVDGDPGTDGTHRTDGSPAGQGVDGSGVATDDAAPSTKTAIAVGGAVVLAASVALTIAGEKWLFRRAEARAAAGVRFAHTRTGLVLGALSAALALVPEPSERS